MTSVKDKLVVLSDHDAERIKQAEKRLLQSEKKVESQTPKESTGLIPLESSKVADQFQNLTFKITDVKTLSTTSIPKLGRPKKIRYKTLPNGQQIKIVPKRRRSLMNGPTPSTSRLPSRATTTRTSHSASLLSRTTSNRPPPNRFSLNGGLPSRNIPRRIPPSRASLSGAVPSPRIQIRNAISDPSSKCLIPNRMTSNRAVLGGTISCRVPPIRAPIIRPLQSLPIPNKIIPKIVQEEVPSPASADTITKITTKEKLISSSPSPSPTTEPTSSSGSAVSSKRKSHHVIKPITEITFEESVEVVRNENTELMEYVACLRVALNNLLSEVDMGPLELPGAIGKVKIFEKVEQMIKRNEETDDEEEQEDILSISGEKEIVEEENEKK